MKSKKGFTLIELLIVIVIIGILAAIVIGLVGTTAQRKARNASRESGVRALSSALELYRTDNDTYPADEAALAGDLTPTYMREIPELVGTDAAWGYVQTEAGACYTITLAREGGGDDITISCQQ